MTPLTFDCLLNCLDGVERTDGIFTIVTTNDISKVDPALGQPRKLPDGTTEFISTRPGTDPQSLSSLAPQDYNDLAAQQKVFESIAAIANGALTLRDPGAEPEEIRAQRVTADFFKECQMFDGSSIAGWKALEITSLPTRDSATPGVAKNRGRADCRGEAPGPVSGGGARRPGRCVPSSSRRPNWSRPR